MLPNSLYEARITLIPKPNKDTCTPIHTDTHTHTYTHKLLANILDDHRYKIFSKILANSIQHILILFSSGRIHTRDVRIVEHIPINKCDIPH